MITYQTTNEEFEIGSDQNTVWVNSSRWGCVARICKHSGDVMERTRIGGYAQRSEELYVLVVQRHETFRNWAHRVFMLWAVHVGPEHCPGWDISRQYSFTNGRVPGPTLKTTLGAAVEARRQRSNQ